MLRVLLVAAGGAMGSLARWGIAEASLRWGRVAFPWWTLSVNLAGCLAIGIVSAFAAPRGPLGPDAKLLLVTGLLGGFTTFSAFGQETMELTRQGRAGLAFLYVAASIAGGLLTAAGGHVLARWLGAPSGSA